MRSRKPPPKIKSLPPGQVTLAESSGSRASASSRTPVNKTSTDRTILGSPIIAASLWAGGKSKKEDDNAMMRQKICQDQAAWQTKPEELAKRMAKQEVVDRQMAHRGASTSSLELDPEIAREKEIQKAYNNVITKTQDLLNSSTRRTEHADRVMRATLKALEQDRKSLLIDAVLASHQTFPGRSHLPEIVPLQIRQAVSVPIIH